MTEYIIKIGFWVRAYDSFTVEADSDEQAIEKAKTAAKTAMDSLSHPEHFDEERREGVIVFIDRLATDGERHEVIENVEFDDDRIHGVVAACPAAPPRNDGGRGED
jgi:hypothetical protein